MTAIRNFPNAPARLARPAPGRQLSAWARKAWQMLRESAQHRADAETARVLADPVLARQFNAAVAFNRSGAALSTPITTSRSPS